MLPTLKYPLLALSCLPLAQFAHAQTITTTTGDGADSYIRYGSLGTTNYGTQDTIQVRLHPGFETDGASAADGDKKNSRMGYLRFDLSSLTSAPRTGVDGDVTLNLTWSGAFDGGSTPLVDWSLDIYGLNEVGGSDPAWTNSGLDATNAPASKNIYGVEASETTKLAEGLLSTAAAQYDTFTISSAALTNFILADTDGFVTFILVAGAATTSGSPIASFYANGDTNSTNLPSLSVIPEPGTAALLLGMLVGGLVLIRRRK